MYFCLASDCHRLVFGFFVIVGLVFFAGWILFFVKEFVGLGRELRAQNFWEKHLRILSLIFVNFARNFR